MDNLDKKIVSNIIELIELKGVRQSFIENLIGGRRGKITDWKLGRSTPTREEAGIILKHFNMSEKDLCGSAEGAVAEGNFYHEMNNYLKDFISSTENLFLLPEDEKKDFEELINNLFVLIRYSKTIGAADNLMGHKTALNRFHDAAARSVTILGNMMGKAYKKNLSLYANKQKARVQSKAEDETIEKK